MKIQNVKNTHRSKDTDGMIQQSIDKINYAGSSSNHDNTHRQSLINQES